MKMALAWMWVAGAIGIGMPSAQAAWPEKPIKLIVPTAAGGAPDIVARLFGDALSKRLGQAIVVENRPGAGGNIGMQALLQAPADGYTIAYGNNATLATNRFLYSRLPYDPDKLVPIVGLVTTFNILAVNNALPVKSVRELIAYAQANPGKLSMGSAGNGTTSHLGGELFKTLAQLNIEHVPYKGSTPALQDLVGNNVQLMFENVPSIGPYVGSNKVRALAVTSTKRSPHFPQVPTMDEAGIKGYELTAWAGLVGAPGIPGEVVDRLNREVNAVIRDPGFRARLDQLSFEPLGGSPRDFQALVASETVKFGELVRKSGAKVD
ncbi:Bug family tripartite tricarboxylate transporter substrate binding protein [Cupriavidus gilardii]|uniref:Bug family tripartite tricarboxylate transporter substrate binding protein n=1 Tax=Cupriavidus gilardii TaxID=82541 RepID=UPI0020C6F949|nr:tripartite tricarboxylate transporter substrate binding protein [Cupriavidus gilardii]